MISKYLPTAGTPHDAGVLFPATSAKTNDSGHIHPHSEQQDIKERKYKERPSNIPASNTG
jgi:hypothetical protein